VLEDAVSVSNRLNRTNLPALKTIARRLKTNRIISDVSIRVIASESAWSQDVVGVLSASEVLI
jgi:hypothetical protein